jgi:hypothetical protein
MQKVNALGGFDSGSGAFATHALVGLMTTGTQDQGFANRIVVQIEAGFLITCLAGIAPHLAWQPHINEKDRVVVQKRLHR